MVSILASVITHVVTEAEMRLLDPALDSIFSINSRKRSVAHVDAWRSTRLI